MVPVLIPCSRSVHDQNVLARRPQWDQHGYHSDGERQASLEGLFRMVVVRRAQGSGVVLHPWGELRRR
jgi:hypothetical protein